MMQQHLLPVGEHANIQITAT